MNSVGNSLFIKIWTWTGSEWKGNDVIKAYSPDVADRWSTGNIGQQMAYGFMDGIYSLFNDNHLGGKGFENYDDKINTRLLGLSTFIPNLL